MMRWLLASVIAIACALCTPARAQSADAVYSNLGNFRNQSVAPGGATLQVLNTITRLMADDLHLVGTPPYAVNGFRFVVTNLNGVDVAASPLIRFWLPDGPGGGPGTLIAAFSYSPITFTAGRVGTIKTTTTFTLPSSHVWAGIAFDDNGGSTGATALQLDNLALGSFSPPTLGTSSDQYFISALPGVSGSFAIDNPPGTLGNFGGAPPADFGWEILAAQDVDLSITLTDGVTTVYRSGSVVYTIVASNAGPDTVFGARVVDDFDPSSLTCTWTCAGSAGNSCAAGGIGNINDATVNLSVGGSVTYTATCAVSATAPGALVNTATVFAPGTAVDANTANNVASDLNSVAIQSDLGITMTDGVTTVTPGGSVTYTIVASNAGPGDADASVIDTFPASLACAWTCVGTSGGSCQAAGSGNINDVVYLPVGGIVTYTATCAISPSATGTLTNTATVLSPAVTDLALGNNVATDSDQIVPVVPGAPTIGTASAGNAQATVSFTPPAFNGGSPIMSYLVTSSPPGFIASGPASPITVNGLANGTAYTFTVKATNAVGTGPASAPSNTVTPLSLPGAPTIAIATAGNAQATIAFAAPASDGGSPITSYTVVSSPGGISVSGPGSPLVMGGLANGTAYTFTVTATNPLGTGPASAPSNSVTPATVPGAPTIGPALPGNSQAVVTFTAPASNGGSPITSYTVTSSPPGVIAGGTASPITVTGLSNGIAYTFTVTATNAVGVGPSSAPSNSVTPRSFPSAPPVAIATAGNAQATVAFAAPSSDGGSPITSYTATSSPGGISVSGPGSPLTVSGLTNGTPYTFTVTATTGVGTGPASPPSNSVTPSTVPGAPIIGVATPGNAQATVSFTAPVSNGGSPITSYTVTSSPPGVIASGVASPITLSGLANGTTYTFTVTATNAVGVGPPSAPSNSVTPAAVPGAPTIGSAAAGNAQATVTFTAPVSNGGSPITSYTVTSSPAGITASGAASPITVGGLANGTAYIFTVTATNAAGSGPASAPSNRVTPGTVPGAPTIGIATAGNAQAAVTFTAPASNGGSPVTSYTVTSSPGGISASGVASPVTVSGLANGTAYTFTATAINAIGAGPASAPSNSVTPAGVPGAPTIGVATAGNAQAVVSFTPPASSGGSPITSYTVTSSPGGISVSGAGSPITVSGLANGTAYTFTVTAANALGTGPASAPSNSVTPAAPSTVPGAPTIVAGIPGNGRATIAFNAPASNGGSPITSYTATCGAFSVSGPVSPLTVTGLTNLTAYSCSVTATNAVGTGPASGPASVTPDSVARSYVAPSASGSGTIAAVFTGGGIGCAFTSSAFIPLSGDPASPPAGSTTISFPHGLFDFTLGGCTPGSAVTFTIVYPAALAAGTQYWKYGPEPGTPSPHWYVLPASITGSVVTFSITDGGQGDDDLAANGSVVDQGGPGAPPVGGGAATPVPTLSQWAMLLLSLMLAVLAPRPMRAGASRR